MNDPEPRGELLTGREPATPFRLFGRVALVIIVVFLLVGGLAFGLWEAFK